MWYDMKVDATNAIIDCLENGYDGHYCDLHNEVFNIDYYVTGMAEAKNILGEGEGSEGKTHGICQAEEARQVDCGNPED